MKEISRVKRLEVAQCYLLGYTYKEIEEKTGMSHVVSQTSLAKLKTAY